jgi:hypothetical protein
MNGVTIGQVIVGVRDLERATRRFERMGLCVVDGGVHPGVGTANRVIPLGSSYLELLGVVDHEQASSTPFGQSLLRRTVDADRLVRWSIRTDSIGPVCARLGLTAEQRRRVRPDGSVLTWQAAGLDLSLRESWLPFFMQWDDPSEFPGSTVVRHPIGKCSLSWLRISPTDPARLARWTEDDPALPLRFAQCEEGIEAVAIATPYGEMIIDNLQCNT